MKKILNLNNIFLNYRVLNKHFFIANKYLSNVNIILFYLSYFPFLNKYLLKSKKNIVLMFKKILLRFKKSFFSISFLNILRFIRLSSTRKTSQNQNGNFNCYMSIAI